MDTDQKKVVQFSPFSSAASPAFWQALIKLKLDVFKLSQDNVPIWASYNAGRTVIDRETDQDIALPCHLVISEAAFEDTEIPPPLSAVARGSLKNFNTIEEFKSVDKQALFNKVAEEMWSTITSKSDPTEALCRFLLITFADLKKYKFYYWFAFPAFVTKPSWEIHPLGWKAAESVLGKDVMKTLHAVLSASPSRRQFFLVRNQSTRVEIAPITEYRSFFDGITASERAIGFLDPSAHSQSPGWPLRNLLAYLAHIDSATTAHSSLEHLSLNILCWRDSEIPRDGQAWKSRFGTVSQPRSGNHGDTSRPAAVGWERNSAAKLAPRVADLAPMMDPFQLAEQAMDLNLKLMRWRILPSLDLDRIANTKCLLLGAGTLGCFVARALMAWGVRTITFVDSGKVSFSNPVRQSLFEFEDCLDGGKPKAEAAAGALKRIYPGINATGHLLSIPMPGHPIPPNPALVDQTRADVKKLEELIDSHDAIFLLMDSRESRWLPTMIGKSKNKIVINAALGFDSFLVMRHGARKSGPSALGCYYCNDIVAPLDSLTDRTLDQMCTVTRPGLASIASANAVELLSSLLQHPDGVHAPAPPLQKNVDEQIGGNYEGVLGIVPHQLRGFLARFNSVLVTGAAYDQCTACSEKVITEYETAGFDMLLQVFNDPTYLEHLTGLDKVQSETEAMLESIDWDEGDSAEED